MSNVLVHNVVEGLATFTLQRYALISKAQFFLKKVHVGHSAFDTSTERGSHIQFPDQASVSIQVYEDVTARAAMLMLSPGM